MESAPSPEEIQQFLESLVPPQFPDEIFDPRDAALGQVVDWKRSTASAELAGLLTEPRFHANTIRLEWLQRLVLSRSAGRRKPQPRELSAALNEGLGRAGVLRLEDPIEDLFCERIATSRGDFRIFMGVWEGAGAYTQTLLDAFEALPPGGLKDQTLHSVYALLQLSDELAARAGADRNTLSSGQPAGELTVPAAEELKHLSRRVRFSDADLGRLQVDEAQAQAWLAQDGKPPAASDIAVRIAPGGAGIGDYVPVCALALKNIGTTDLERCLVEMIEFSGTLPPNIALPLTLRTANQIRGDERGRFLLSSGQEAIIPLAFHRPQRANEWFLVDDSGTKHFFSADPTKMIVRIYGGPAPGNALVFINTDAGWKALPMVSTVSSDVTLWSISAARLDSLDR